MSEDNFKGREPESVLLSGSVRRTWLQLAANLGRPRNSLTMPIGYNPFREARRMATKIFMYQSCSLIIIPATVAAFPAAMRAGTVIGTNDDRVRIGSRWDGNDGRKSQSDSKNGFVHRVLPRVIRPRLNDGLAFAFHKNPYLRLQSEETSDHWRTADNFAGAVVMMSTNRKASEHWTTYWAGETRAW